MEVHKTKREENMQKRIDYLLWSISEAMSDISIKKENSSETAFAILEKAFRNDWEIKSELKNHKKGELNE